MIFNFLRQYLKDHEYEQTKIELVETRAALEEYKNFILEQKELTKEDKEKVDPDFLVFIWATIGFAFLILGESAKNTLALQENRSALFYIWLAVALFSIVFIVFNSLFALELTRTYAASKSNPRYLNYAYSLIIGAVLLVGALLGIAFIK